MYTVDESLLERARVVLAGRPDLRFVVGGSGTGKSTVCAGLAERFGVELLDMDARLYGSWHARFDAVRHPANRAWSDAADPLAWQLAMQPAAFLAFHEASTAEALDLLVDELLESGPPRPALVDGGFGSVGVLARVVPAESVACLSLPMVLRAGVWTGSTDRRAFLEIVAQVPGVDDPVARFLALDQALSARMVADAHQARIRVLERAADEPVAATVNAVEAHLGLGAVG